MAKNTRHVLGSCPVRTTKSVRTFRDPWLTYLVAQADGEITTEVVRAFQSIDDMIQRGVEMTEALADYVLSTSVAGARRPSGTGDADLKREHLDRLLKAVTGDKDDPRSRVYFIRWGDKVKIGTSTDVAARVRSLSLPPDALVATAPGGYKHEAYLHGKFSAYRIKSTEWFRQNRELDDYIAELSGLPL